MWKRGGARSERRKKSRSGGDARETVGAFNDSKLDHNVAGWGGRGGGGGRMTTGYLGRICSKFVFFRLLPLCVFPLLRHARKIHSTLILKLLRVSHGTVSHRFLRLL